MTRTQSRVERLWPQVLLLLHDFKDRTIPVRVSSCCIPLLFSPFGIALGQDTNFLSGPRVYTNADIDRLHSEG